MNAPIISNTTSVLGYRKGQYFEYQMYASESPTAWTATGLPTGMTIDATGKISGAATTAGVYIISVVATNAYGSSTPLVVAMGIEDTTFNDGVGVEVNIDLPSGAVNVPGVVVEGSSTDAPVMFLKHGDKIFLDVGFLKGEELQSMSVISLVMHIREFDGETILVQSDGLIQDIGTTDRPRYRIVVDLDSDVLRTALGNYEADFRTEFNGIAEFEWHVAYAAPGALAPELTRSSQTFRVRVTRDLIPIPPAP